MRESGPDPLEQAGHPGALVVVARLTRARADAAADDQHADALACRAQACLIKLVKLACLVMRAIGGSRLLVTSVNLKN